MKKTFLGALLLFSAISGTAWADDFSAPAGDGFVEDAFTWTEEGNGYEFRWGIEVIEGRIAVCGVGRFVSAHTRMQTLAMMRKTKIVRDGKTILKDITFFNTVKTKGPLEGQQATCRDTGVAAPDREFDIYMEVQGIGRF